MIRLNKFGCTCASLVLFAGCATGSGYVKQDLARCNRIAIFVQDRCRAGERYPDFQITDEVESYVHEELARRGYRLVDRSTDVDLTVDEIERCASGLSEGESCVDALDVLQADVVMVTKVTRAETDRAPWKPLTDILGKAIGGQESSSNEPFPYRARTQLTAKFLKSANWESLGSLSGRGETPVDQPNRLGDSPQLAVQKLTQQIPNATPVASARP